MKKFLSGLFLKKLREHAAVKSIGGIVLLLVVFSLIVSIIGFNSFTEALLAQYSEGAFLTAETAAQYIDADRIDAYKESAGVSVEYHTVWKELDMLCNSSGSTFIYVIEPDLTDYAHITFIFSTINHESTYTHYDFGYYRETTNDEYREKYRALYEQTAEQELLIRDKGYIETDPHITAMIGLKDSEGQVRAILCVQRQMDVMAMVRNSYIGKIVLVLIVLALIVILGQSAFLYKELLHPLQLITEETKRFSKENTVSDPKLKDSISSKDEIGQLAASIDRMEERIQSYVENITRITAEKERISTELSLATRLQAAFLPHIFPPFPDRHEFDIYASMTPAKEVGGDFYDFFMIDDNHLCLVMADVSGKGVPAALFMMVSKIIIQSCAMLGQSAAETLTKTNQAICSNNQEDMFVTVWLGILEISTGKITCANAGHEYPAVKTPDGSFELYKDRHGMVIGAFGESVYRQYELQLEPGSKIFVYTDGVPEATDGRGKMFGTDRMVAALNEVCDRQPKEILARVSGSVEAFVNDAEQFDDLTMLCFEYKGTFDRDELEVEAVTENLDEVQQFIDERLEACDCPAKAKMQIDVAVEEIFINMANYAYAPEKGKATVRVEISEQPLSVTVTFMDNGIPYDPIAKADPDVTLSADEREVGGLGIYMTKKIMDDVSYEYKNGRNILTLKKNL